MPSTALCRWRTKRAHSSSMLGVALASLIMSRRATSNTAPKLILTQSFRVYSRPGMADQWQPE